jgi:hypothetical protein
MMARLGIYRLYALLVIFYSVFLLVMPANPATLAAYHLNNTSYRTLLFVVIALPAFLTWLAAFIGYNHLARYSLLLKNANEEQPFRKLSQGVKWLALYLPVVSCVSLVLAGIANAHPGFRAFADIFSTYLSIVIALGAFTAVSSGARQLSTLAKTRPSLLKTKILIFSFIVMGVTYCYFIVKHGLDSQGSPYHLPLGWMLVTTVVPYFFAWMLGLLAVLDIDSYAVKVSGVLYRRALQQLSAGLLTVIASSVLIQYVNSAALPGGKLVFGLLLTIRYLLYAGLAAGFVLIASSAKKLQQIEKI